MKDEERECAVDCKWRAGKVVDNQGHEFFVLICRKCGHTEDADLELLDLMEYRDRMRQIQEVMARTEPPGPRRVAAPKPDPLDWRG